MHHDNNSNKREIRYGDGHVIVVNYGAKGVDLGIEITHTNCGRDFSFTLKGHHLAVYPGKQHSHGNGNLDWYKALNERERLDLIKIVGENYRAPSLDVDGVKTAAIGVVENRYADTEATRHLIYVGVNTNRLASDYFKDCAEQAVVNVATTSQAHYQYHKLHKEPEPAKIKDIYVVGGKDPDPDSGKPSAMPAICPCGKCTDMLAKAMVKEGRVYVMPFGADTNSAPVNETADVFSEVLPGEIWKTTIDHLNRKRFVPLDMFDVAAQRKGYDALVDALVYYKRGAVPVSDEVVAKTVSNTMKSRKSIAELDIATKRVTATPAAVDHYMAKQLLEILDARLSGAKVERSHFAIREWLDNNITRVRLAIVQLNNGSYHLGGDAQTVLDKAFPNAEVHAGQETMKSIPEYTVQRMWVKEFCPKDIAAGIMATSPKEGVERVIKRVAPKDIDNFRVCYLPVNNGKMNRKEVEDMVQKHTFSLEDLYPGAFMGAQTSQGKAAAVIEERGKSRRKERLS